MPLLVLKVVLERVFTPFDVIRSQSSVHEFLRCINSCQPLKREDWINNISDTLSSVATRDYIKSRFQLVARNLHPNKIGIIEVADIELFQFLHSAIIFTDSEYCESTQHAVEYDCARVFFTSLPLYL